MIKRVSKDVISRQESGILRLPTPRSCREHANNKKTPMVLFVDICVCVCVCVCVRLREEETTSILG